MSNLLRVLAVWLLSCSAIAVSSGDKHKCDRVCNADEPPMECDYTFNVEWYHTMSKACGNCTTTNETDCYNPGCILGDGRPRSVMLVNKMMPGPAIRVCHKDTIKVKVFNHLVGGESITIHWHGLFQSETPFMDGASMITQCPIVRETSFAYKFKADPPGTHWWHAHTGLQRGEGVAGSLIVKQDRRRELNSDQYDEDLSEHVLMIYDWNEQDGISRMINFLNGGPIFFADNAIINGVGYTKETENNDGFRNKFKVRSGLRYRFRVISNVVTFCPAEISVDNHKLTIIATDGVAVEPYAVTNIFVRSGERFDFVIDANQPLDNYWFRIQTSVECNFTHNAYLNYEGVSKSAAPSSTTWKENIDEYKTLNPPNVDFGYITELVPLYSNDFPKDKRIEGTPDAIHYLGGDMLETWLVFNGVENIMPSSPLLSQPEKTPVTCNPEISQIDQFCNEGRCSCVHVIDIRLNDVVDLVVYDVSTITHAAGHAFHLHGQNFHVIHMEKISNTNVSLGQVKDLYEKDVSSYNTRNPVIKDTVGVPASGFAVLRFVAENPGVWLFHCHVGMHVNFGMSVSLRVGYPNLPTPPLNFPKCGSWEEEQPVTNSSPVPTYDDKELNRNKLKLVMYILNKLLSNGN